MVSNAALARGLVASLALLPALAGCGAAVTPDTSVYASCLRDPVGWRDGTVRGGHVSAMRLEVDRFAGPPGHNYRVTLSRKACLDHVKVEGYAKDFEGGPYLPLHGDEFASIDDRLAFSFQTTDRRAWVWIDGAVHGPYENVTVSPYFSENGDHIAYAARDGEGEALFIDGRVTRRGAGFSDQHVFRVLDDGRVAAARVLEDGRREIVVGSYTSEPLDELCYNRAFRVGPRGRWAYAARSGKTWMVVVDGQKTTSAGVPMSCDFVFSESGARVGYIAVQADGSRGQRTVVIDGQSRPISDDATSLHFVGELPVVTVEQRRDATPGRIESWEHTFVIVGPSTPSAKPTLDDYEPMLSGARGQSVRVQIGGSIGPRFDRLVKGSLKLDGDGRLRYRAERGQAAFDVIDNVLQERTELQVPEAAATEAHSGSH